MSALTFEDGPDWVDENNVRLGDYRQKIDALAPQFARGGVDLKGPKAVAYVNHGRWLADCPLGDGEARLVNPAYEFFCIGCGNTFAVLWPDAKTMKQITKVLEQRPASGSQNWYPHESVADLTAENADRGLLTSPVTQ